MAPTETSTSNTTDITALNYVPGQLYHLDPFTLNTDPNQPRKTFDPADMKALMDSVTRYGVLEPVIAKQEQDGSITLIAGERRTLAAREAALANIPVLFTDKPSAEVALIENMLRSDLTALEEAEAIKRLQDEAKFKNKDIAIIIGKAESTVSEILSLNKLPDSIKNKVRSDKRFTRAELNKIAGKGKDEAVMLVEFEALVSAKAGAAPAKPVVSPVDQFKAKVEGFVKSLNALNMSELEDAARSSVIEQLESLATLIDTKTATA